jgi:hypothetical protein
LAQYASQNDAQRKAGEAILAMARSGSYKSEESVKWTKDDANDRYASWPKSSHS